MNAEMSSPVPALRGVTQLQVRQRRELLEVFSGWETKNRYEVSDGTGAPIFYAGEVGGGVGAFFLRQWLGSKRPFPVVVKDAAGATVLVVKRPWRWFFARAEIRDASGRLLGAIQQRFSIFTRRYAVEGPTGAVGAELHGPFFKPWTFELQVHGRTVGKIAKRWSGLLKEAFTDADNFGLELAPEVDERLRPLVLGATFLIDFVHFEKNG